MRLCIEQGLHKHPPPSSGTTLINEQLERRVFWECYMIDRYSSITLDRPCAIAERYIEIGFPADANDEELLAADTSGSFTDLDSFCAASSTAPSSTLANTEMSVFFACLRLRQITSRIHSKFCAQDRSRTARNNTLVQGIVYEELDELLSALQQWRQSTPVFHTPQTLYETQEWYDLLYFRERLQLIRKAIDIVPKWNSIPPRELLSLCSESAVGAISAFWQLFESRKITFTRSYFQMLFTAGLSVMYCMSAVKDIDSESIRAGIDAVTKCEEILKKMGVNLPDAKRYIAVYESLSEYVIRKCSRNSREEVQYRPQEWFPSNPHEQTIPSISTMTTNERHAPSNLPEILVESAPFIRHYGLASTGTHGTSENMSSSDNCTNVQLMTGAYSSIYPDAPLSEGSVLTCDIFADDALWSMEAGLNEYAYGDPPAILYLNDAFDPQSFV
ncbi:hypothetical protein N7462_005672 [Penicillium macrosclerotiorum]|uniref:uncharacterized protein n=1 Tax=Penicillium macrosclerotiorum TaxID=303699 RepID=UPI0025483446|nr:uncharacterized protein N7462_005672 [Penicillium macrosclerotiorum]KAJ5682507.1 hypothetical protein N7462_005672 [Penicillium macrosclerotiorum]